MLAGAVGIMAFIFLRAVVDVFYSGAEAAQVVRLIVRNKVAITQTLPLSYFPRIASLPGVTAITHQSWFGGRSANPSATSSLPWPSIRPPS